MPGKDDNKNTIPLRRVALYKHGIGYFERRGKFKGPGEVELMCGPDEIDDMLKSLLVLRDGGKQIAAITYESSKTLETRLAEFGFDLRNCRGMIELIGQLKGAPVTVDISGESVVGRVIGLDATKQVIGESTVDEHQLVLYTDEKSLRRLALSAIKNLTVNDPSLSEEIQQQLELLFQATRKKDQKLLKVQVSDDEERTLQIVYSIPCPIWKTTYRLVAVDDTKLILQGSAIVDNTQEEDWNDVEMTLVSASPVSFIQPLYDPVQPHRTTISAQGVNSSQPFVAERAHASRKTRIMGAPEPVASPAAAPPVGSSRSEQSTTMGGHWGAPAGMAQGGAWGSAPAKASMVLDELKLDISTQETGDQFEYNIQTPVTVPRNSSALINIVQQTVDGERISLYNESRNRTTPYSAIRLKNTTGLTLEAGPITVMENNSYAGEALLDVVKPDDTRFVAYAIDQSVRVVVRHELSRKPVWRIRCWQGFLYLDFKEMDQKTYHLENLSDKKKTVFVEHAVVRTRNLVGDVKPSETTENFYRFRQELQAKEAAPLTVTEESDGFNNVWLESFDNNELPELAWALRQNFVDNSFKAFLEEVMKRREEIFLLQHKERHLREVIGQCQKDQERARENVKAVGTANERYKNAIDQAEDRIMKSSAELTAVLSALSEKRLAFNSFVAAQLAADIEQPLAVPQRM
ncbi:MAG TPA: hypothetical protein V6C81_23135 [Planktothrix sp.]|jgi:hypothetical protein